MALGFGGSASSRSIHYMNQAKSAMDKSLLKISSGSRLVSPGDDPGGIAVAMKLRSSIATNDVAKNRVENAKSYVDMQHSTLQSASDIITEMQGLLVSYGGTSNADEQAIYEGQFNDLKSQLSDLGGGTINGQTLFNRVGGASIEVATSSNGSATVELDDLDYQAAVESVTGNSSGLAEVNISDADAGTKLDTALTEVGSLLGAVGSDQSTLGFASDYLSSTSTNLESALGRIQDVDLAEETANYAALTLRYEAAAAAIAQANASADTVFNLLIGSLGKD
jgi:flagellin